MLFRVPATTWRGLMQHCLALSDAQPVGRYQVGSVCAISPIPTLVFNHLIITHPHPCFSFFFFFFLPLPPPPPPTQSNNPRYTTNVYLTILSYPSIRFQLFRNN